MKSTNWKDVAELIGIAAIVASLLFVGLQMKQSQEIAIASHYHEHAALAIEVHNEQLASGNLALWGSFAGSNAPPELSAEDLGRYYLYGLIYLTQVDNHYFQYQSGFLDEQLWQAQYAFLKNVLASPNSPARVAWPSARYQFRAPFIELTEQIIKEADADAINR